MANSCIGSKVSTPENKSPVGVAQAEHNTDRWLCLGRYVSVSFTRRRPLTRRAAHQCHITIYVNWPTERDIRGRAVSSRLQITSSGQSPSVPRCAVVRAPWLEREIPDQPERPERVRDLVRAPPHSNGPACRHECDRESVHGDRITRLNRRCQ